MPTYTLSGIGTQAVDEPGSLALTINEFPDFAGQGEANPPDFYHLGLIRLGTDHGFLPPIPVHAESQLIPCPNGVTVVGYSLQDGVEIDLEERPELPYAGPTGPPGEDGADGSTGPIDFLHSTLASPVTTTANTYATALSMSLAAGTWFVLGQITVYQATTAMLVGRLTDLTTHYASGSGSSISGTDATISLAAIIVLTGTTTIYLQGASQGAGSIKATLQTNAAGATATRMQALRIA